ncbi:MAG: dihydroorotase [Crocinitomicaceae bacterium]|nr:dihydroorotase [Crocinitomicaceae bacterium]
MRILVRQAKVVDNESEYKGQVKDILIENGKIISIQDKISEDADEVVEHPNLHVSIGWFDLRARFCDPGLEHKETIDSGLSAAEFGGFTGVGVVSNTHPPISSKGQVEYLIGKSNLSPVELVPIGSVTDNAGGEQLAEMYDMSQAGARAFCDDKPLNSGILYRALLYANNFDSVIFDLASDSSLAGKGQINEGKSSVLTGLKGIPDISEIIRVKRDIDLLKYTDGQLHLTSISCADSVQEIKDYKKGKTNLTSDTSIHHLQFTDTDVEGFDSNLKIFPPLRGKKDQDALKKGVLDGSIDCICSDHNPQDKESKDLEFDLAEFGIIGIQTFFSSVLDVFGVDQLDKIIDAFTKNPRRVLGMDAPEIKEGVDANLTFFVPDLEWEYTKESNISLSQNSPLLGQKLKGKAIGLINKGVLSLQK